MIRITAFAGALLCLLVTGLSPAMAAGLHPRCNIDWPCGPEIFAKIAKKSPRNEAREVARADRFRNVDFGSPMYPPETARSWLNGLAKPTRYISGRLICAINVNAALAERGIRGTGSALARSFDRWGIRSPVAVVGAVAVTDRRGGGHVAIVSRVEGGRVFVWNPSPRGRGWREVEYTNRRARYRVAG